MVTSPFTDTLAVEVATLQAQHPILADALSRAHTLLTDGRLFPEDDGRRAMVRSSDGATWYAVNGQCPCKASAYHEEPCKHRLAFRLYQKVADRLADEEERWTIALAPDVPANVPEAERIPPQFITELHGKPFVQYTGLLALAHARGLVSLKARLISVTPELALADAEAVFADGHTFTEAADATPQNVGAQVKVHFARMALTRAKARCLRDALNIGICSLEEVEA